MTEPTRPWRLALALVILRNQVNVLAPKRSKASDGAIGNIFHASRDSDHNPWIIDGDRSVVSAIDITHDPEHGFNSFAFAETLRRKRDPRIKYVISNGRMFASYTNTKGDAWEWRPYAGANAHKHHVHVSVRQTKEHYDSSWSWAL